MSDAAQGFDLRNLTASYLGFSELRRNHPIDHILPDHAFLQYNTIHLVFDYRSVQRPETNRCDFDEPQSSYTLAEFRGKLRTFHPYDTFSLQYDGSILGRETDFAPSFAQRLATEYIRRNCPAR